MDTHDRFEFGRVVTCVLQLLRENLSLFDQAMTQVKYLTEIHNKLVIPAVFAGAAAAGAVRLVGSAELLDLLCELASVLRGGQLLNQLILLEENESSQRKRLLLRDLLHHAAHQYFLLMQDYLYRGNIGDFYQVALSSPSHPGVHGRPSTGGFRAFRPAVRVRTESHARTLRHRRK